DWLARFEGDADCAREFPGFHPGYAGAGAAGPAIPPSTPDVARVKPGATFDGCAILAGGHRVHGKRLASSAVTGSSDGPRRCPQPINTTPNFRESPEAPCRRSH